MIRKIHATLICAGVSMILSVVHAVPVTFTVEQGYSGGSSFSYLHTATSGYMEFDGYDFWANGATNQIGVGQTLTGNYDAASRSITDLGGTISISSGSGPFSGNLILSNGHFTFLGPDNGGLVGDINYQTTGSGHSGTFYFYDYNFGGAPGSGANNLSVVGDLLDIQLWGNDDVAKDYGTSWAPPGLNGLDIRLTGTAPTTGVPDTGGTLILLSLGLLFLIPIARKFAYCPTA